MSSSKATRMDLQAAIDDRSDSAIPAEVGSIGTISSKFSDIDVDDGNDEDEFNFLRAKGRRTQTSSTSSRSNIFQKLKESLFQTIIGFLLIVCVPIAIWKNEGRHVDQLSRIEFCKNNAVVVDCNTSSNENVGRLVHFTGSVTVGDSVIDFGPSDKDLNLIEPISGVLLLQRTCYIYQTFEVAQKDVKRDRVGGGETRTTTYTRKDDWTHAGPQNDCPNIGVTNSRGVWDRLVAATEVSNATANKPPMNDATTKHQEMAMKMAKAQNQGASMPLEMARQFGLYDPNKAPQARAISSATRVGEFALSEKAIAGNPAVFTSEYTPVPMEYLPDKIPACDSLRKGSDNTLRTFEEGQEPQNGDIKIVYEYVADGIEASFVVAQTATVPEKAKFAGAKFGVDECAVTGRCNTDLDQIWMIRKGNHNLHEMLNMAKEEEKAITKTIRIVVWVLLCVGWVMLFAPLITILEVLPLLSKLGFFAVVVFAVPVSLLCCFTIMLLAYMRYRPVITGALLVVALGIWGIVAWRLQYASELYAEESSF